MYGNTCTAHVLAECFFGMHLLANDIFFCFLDIPILVHVQMYLFSYHNV